MGLVTDGRFESDRIDLLIGFDGTEPKEIMRWSRVFQFQFPSRLAIAISQYYPELASKFYRNGHLIVILQKLKKDSGLFIVIEDNYRESGLVPVELQGMAESDDYLLVEESLRIMGRLRLWESLGGKGSFYHDNLIMEVVTDAKICETISGNFQKRCDADIVAHSIRVAS